MPCNSDYMEANTREIELSRVACLLGEVNGVKWRQADWEGYHPKIYCTGISKQEADRMVAELCKWCQNHDVSKFSLEMQIWWRDHQQADKERLQEELLQKKTDEEYKKARNKLTPYERELLGIK